MTAIQKSFTLKSASVILFGVWLIIYFFGLGQTSITDPNEGYYVEAGREMVEGGNWIVPHLNYQVYFSKPILNFWLIALPYKLFGINEFSARVLFSLLALSLFAGVMLFTHRLRNERSAILAAIMCATAPLMMAASRISPIDIALTCFLNLGLFAWIISNIFGDRRFWPWFYVFMALAVLIKGPATLFVVVIALIIFLLLDAFLSGRKSIQSIKSSFMQTSAIKQFVWGSLIFLLITVPWYAAVGLATGGLFLKVFFLYENLARFAGYTNFTGSTFYHYLPVLIYCFLPWVFLLIPALNHLWRSYNPLGNYNKANKALVCLYCFSVVLFVILSLSGTQMDTYLLPAIPALSVIAGCYLDEISSEIVPKKNSVVNIGSTALAILGAILLLLMPVFIFFPTRVAIKMPFTVTALILAIGCLTQFWLKKKGKYGAMLAVSCGAIVLTCALSFQTVCYRVDQSGPRDLKNLCLLYKRSKDHLILFRAFKPAIMFYTQKPVDSFFSPQYLVLRSDKYKTQTTDNDTRLLLFCHDQYLPLLQQISGLKLKPLNRRGHWQVLLVQNADFIKQATLEELFKNTSVISDTLERKGNWGPLTVPYVAGKQ